MTRSVIVAAVRTPFGRLGGGLAKYEATQLGSFAIKAALERIGLEPDEPEYVIMGQVLQAGAGQAPARPGGVGGGGAVETPAGAVQKGGAASLPAVRDPPAPIRPGGDDRGVARGRGTMT